MLIGNLWCVLQLTHLSFVLFIPVDLAVQLAHHCLFYNQGQICCGPTRTFVHEDIYDAFVAKSVELAQKRILGDPFDEKTMQGPQVMQTFPSRQSADLRISR